MKKISKLFSHGETDQGRDLPEGSLSVLSWLRKSERPSAAPTENTISEVGCSASFSRVTTLFIDSEPSRYATPSGIAGPLRGLGHARATAASIDGTPNDLARSLTVARTSRAMDASPVLHPSTAAISLGTNVSSRYRDTSTALTPSKDGIQQGLGSHDSRSPECADCRCANRGPAFPLVYTNKRVTVV
jgi:hypothetical protein